MEDYIKIQKTKIKRANVESLSVVAHPIVYLVSIACSALAVSAFIMNFETAGYRKVWEPAIILLVGVLIMQFWMNVTASRVKIITTSGQKFHTKAESKNRAHEMLNLIERWVETGEKPVFNLADWKELGN